MVVFRYRRVTIHAGDAGDGWVLKPYGGVESERGPQYLDNRHRANIFHRETEHQVPRGSGAR